jgi:hypothetical protein
VIFGGGPAGLALATTLGLLQFYLEWVCELTNISDSSKSVKESLLVTLVELAGDMDMSKVHNWSLVTPGTFSNRVSSLANASHSLLKVRRLFSARI